jgi:hypothetical protein
MEDEEFKVEAQFSCWFHTYVRNTYPISWNLCFHVPNELTRVQGESKQAHLQRIMYAKAMGVMPGIEDHILLYRGCTWLFELKLPNGTVSDKQKAVHAAQNKAGFPVFILYDTVSVQYIIDQIFTNVYLQFDSITYEIKKGNIKPV